MLPLLLALPLAQPHALQDSSSAALVQEAFEAAQQIEADDKLAGRAWRAVASELVAHGRRKEARALWKRAEAQSTRSPYLLAPLRARLHPVEETRTWLFSMEDREKRALAAEWIVRDAVRREDETATRDALGTLTACHYHGWDPGHDAWLAIGWHAVGEVESAQAWTRSFLSERVYPGMESDFASAIEDLVSDRLRHDDLAEAERVFAEFMKSKKEPLDVDDTRLLFLAEYLELGKFDEARKQLAKLEGATWRVMGRADLAVALDRAGKEEEATAELRLATETAKGGTYALNLILMAVASAGLDERVDAIARPLLAELDDSTPTRELVHLGGTAALTGRDDLLKAIEERLGDDDRRRMVKRCASYYDWTDNGAALGAMLARQDDSRRVFEILDRVAMNRAPERGEEYEAQLAGLVLEHARKLPHAERALLLARVVTLGWAEED